MACDDLPWFPPLLGRIVHEMGERFELSNHKLTNSDTLDHLPVIRSTVTDQAEQLSASLLAVPNRPREQWEVRASGTNRRPLARLSPSFSCRCARGVCSPAS